MYSKKIRLESLERLYDLAMEAAEKRGYYPEEVKDDYKVIKYYVTETPNLVNFYTLGFNEALIAAKHTYNMYKRGKWVDLGYSEEWYAPACECSCCKEVIPGKTKYCPHCGAKMENGG